MADGLEVWGSCVGCSCAVDGHRICTCCSSSRRSGGGVADPGFAAASSTTQQVTTEDGHTSESRGVTKQTVADENDDNNLASSNAAAQSIATADDSVSKENASDVEQQVTTTTATAVTEIPDATKEAATAEKPTSVATRSDEQGKRGATAEASATERNVLYVSAGGDDAADGQSVNTAYKSLQHAINACPDGGTVYIVGTYQTPDKQAVSITKNMTLAGYEQNGAKAELHEGKGVQYYLNIGNGLNVNIKDLVIDGENPDDRPGMGHGRLIMVTLERGRTRYTTLTLDNTEVRNYIGHALINDDNGVAKLIIKDSSIHGYKGSYRSMSSAIMGFSYIEAANSKFHDCNGSYVWPVSGGAIRLYEGQIGVFTNCEFYNNSQHLGGAIYNAGTLTLNDCNFRNNHAIGSDAEGWQDNGGAIYNAGTATINGGSITDNDARSNGGGVYNRDGSAVMTLNGVTIYNNTAGDSGDDIFNRTGGTITVEAVGKGWKLDGHPCTDAVDSWYDDSAGARWNAHDVQKAHLKRVLPGRYAGEALALKAAHDAGAYRVVYRLQNPDGTYSEETEYLPVTLVPLGSKVAVDRAALDAKLSRLHYRFAEKQPTELTVDKSFENGEEAIYTLLLTYDLVRDSEPASPLVYKKPSLVPAKVPMQVATPKTVATASAEKAAPRHMARMVGEVPATGDEASNVQPVGLAVVGAAVAAIGGMLRRRQENQRG